LNYRDGELRVILFNLS